MCCSPPTLHHILPSSSSSYWISQRCRCFPSVFFCLLCASHHAGEDRYAFPNTGSESFVIHLVRNKKLLVSPPCDDHHVDALTRSFTKSIQTWVLDSVKETERMWTMAGGQKQRKTFFSLNVYWAAHYSLFGCRIFTFPNPIM